MASLLLEYFVALIVIIVFSAVYYYYTKQYRIEKFFEKFPSPPAIPFFGHSRDFNSTTELLKALDKYRKEYGSMVHLRIGPMRPVLLCSDYKFLEFLLSNNFLLLKTANLKFLEPWIGTGLITADGGPKWKIHRKLLTPAFHFKILEQFVDTFEADGNIMVEKMATQSGKQSVDIYTYVTKCTLDAICETAMGTKIDVQNNEASAYFQSVKDMCRIFVTRLTSVWQRYDSLFKFSKDYAVQQNAVKILHDYTNDVIRAKREELKQKRKEDNSSEVDDLGRKKKKVFLDLILEAKVDNQSLTDEEIREEVDTFMFAGHDTTATATSFILYCIANNKDVQDKILEEQIQLFGDNKKPKVTYTNLQEMKYLECVVKEGLRLYSPVPFHGRMIDQDVEYNGEIIPKGVSVLIFVRGMHMSPKFYPDPEKFDPSRFENLDNKQPFAFIPFSAGPRNCIGQKFAMLEIKSLVSKVIRHYELFPAYPKHEMVLAGETVLKSLNGVKIGLKLR